MNKEAQESPPFFPSSSIWKVQNFRQNLVNHFKNGRELLEEFDKFTSLARQILIKKKRAPREKTRQITEAEDEGGQNDEKMTKEVDGEDDKFALQNQNEEDEEDDDDEEAEEEQEQQDLATQKRRKALAALAAINPKNLPKTQEDQERVKHKAERLMEKAKKRVASSRLVRELQAEMDEDRPELVHWDDDHQQLFASGLSKQKEARRRYEETNFVRLPPTKEERKAEKQRRQQIGGAGNQLERELLTFGRYRLPDDAGGNEDEKSSRGKFSKQKKRRFEKAASGTLPMKKEKQTGHRFGKKKRIKGGGIKKKALSKRRKGKH